MELASVYANYVHNNWPNIHHRLQWEAITYYHVNVRRHGNIHILTTFNHDMVNKIISNNVCVHRSQISAVVSFRTDKKFRNSSLKTDYDFDQWRCSSTTETILVVCKLWLWSVRITKQFLPDTFRIGMLVLSVIQVRVASWITTLARKKWYINALQCCSSSVNKKLLVARIFLIHPPSLCISTTQIQTFIFSDNIILRSLIFYAERGCRILRLNYSYCSPSLCPFLSYPI